MTTIRLLQYNDKIVAVSKLEENRNILAADRATKNDN